MWFGKATGESFCWTFGNDRHLWGAEKEQNLSDLGFAVDYCAR